MKQYRRHFLCIRKCCKEKAFPVSGARQSVGVSGRNFFRDFLISLSRHRSCCVSWQTDVAERSSWHPRLHVLVFAVRFFCCVVLGLPQSVSVIHGSQLLVERLHWLFPWALIALKCLSVWSNSDDTQSAIVKSLSHSQIWVTSLWVEKLSPASWDILFN